MKSIITFCCCFFFLFGIAQEVSNEKKQQIKEQIAQLRTAHLNSDIDLATKIYHPNLILTSQSGKKYDTKVALLNLKNTFESYENSAIEFLNLAENVVLTNYINKRKYKDFDKGRFRLTVIWMFEKERWQIISMQSSKIKERTTK